MREKSADAVTIIRTAIDEHCVRRQHRQHTGREVVIGRTRRQRLVFEVQTEAQMRDELPARFFVREELECTSNVGPLREHTCGRLKLTVGQKRFRIAPREMQK